MDIYRDLGGMPKGDLLVGNHSAETVPAADSAFSELVVVFELGEDAGAD